MKRQIPVASARVGKNYVTLEGSVTYSSHVQTVTDWQPTKRPVIKIQRPRVNIEELRRQKSMWQREALDRVVDALGMNRNYNDTFKNPFSL